MSDFDLSVGQITSAASRSATVHDHLRDALKATSVELNAHEDGVRVRAYFEGFADAAAAFDRLADVTAAFKTAGSDVKGAVHYGGLDGSDDDRPAAIADAVFFAPEDEEEDGPDFDTTATVDVTVDPDSLREAFREWSA